MTRAVIGAALLALGLAACAGLPRLAPSPAASPLAPSPSAAEVLPAGATPGLVEITVYFTNRAHYAIGTPPFEDPVVRSVPAAADRARAILDEFFLGPTSEEEALGLERIDSGFTGYSLLTVDAGIARLYLVGPCTSNGAVYTIAQPLLANLLPLPEIDYVKIYDEAGTTEVPDGPSNSIPVCLEP